MTTPRILFAANLHWNAGSSHMLAEYANAAATAGYEVGVSTQLSRLDERVGVHLPLVPDIRWATHLVLVFEGRQFLSDPQLDLCDAIPRHRRVVIDPDGHWGETVTIGTDTSAGTYPAASWHSLYSRLTDLVLQPKLRGTPPPGARVFSYFGMPATRCRAGRMPAADDLPFQVQYIGSNWWRWTSLTELVIGARRATPPVTRLRVCGRWWDGETCAGHETATTSVPGWLRRHGVVVAPPVPFGTVVSEMALATISPILVRPVLTTLGFVTPRMFETVASGSLPVFTDDVSYIRELYGEEAEGFQLGTDPGDVLARMVRDPEPYRRRLVRVQRRLQAEYGYPRLLVTLAKLLG